MDIAYLSTEIGMIEIQGEDAVIRSVQFLDSEVPTTSIPPTLTDSVRQLDEYFSGKRKTFELTFDPIGTDFQKRVWKELLKIDYGTTISYLELAIRLGDEKAVRAVGGANGKNPIAIMIPCHRVIGASGKLVGYGGGMERKGWLLKHELMNAKPEAMLF
jgi:methylated-DNA-[protein]-cysteine S-methyltransferase